MAEYTTWKKNPEFAGLNVVSREDSNSFIKMLNRMELFVPDGKPEKEWKLYVRNTWTYAALHASDDYSVDDAAANSSSETQSFAAQSAADEYAMKQKWYPSYCAVKAAAWEAAFETGIKTAELNIKGEYWDSEEVASPASDFASDAVLMASYVAIGYDEFPGKEKHKECAKRRFDVWKKGYGLCCETKEGTLYVYCKGAEQPQGNRQV